MNYEDTTYAQWRMSDSLIKMNINSNKQYSSVNYEKSKRTTNPINRFAPEGDKKYKV